METCRSCGNNADCYLDKLVYNKPIGWYCETCMEKMPAESLKEQGKLIGIVKLREEKNKEKRFLTPGIIKYK